MQKQKSKTNKKLIMYGAVAFIFAVGLIWVINFFILIGFKFVAFMNDPVGTLPYSYAEVPNKFNVSIKDYVLEEVKKAGLNPAEADKIISCESGWNNWAYGINTNGTTDFGLWQINSIHKGTISVEDRFDYKKATEWAINKRLRDGNWSAWTCSSKL